MYPQHELVKAHMDAVTEEIRQDRRKRAVGRGSLHPPVRGRSAP
jgi:hypothetical protein